MSKTLTALTAATLPLAGTELTYVVQGGNSRGTPTSSFYIPGGTDVALVDGGTGASTAAGARTNLGLVIGTDVEAHSANLTSWAGVTRAAGLDTFTATPSSANLKALLTDETGSGAAVFATSPTLVTPALGTPSALVLTNATGLPIAGGGTGQATASSAFDALAPTTTRGDLIFRNATTNARLAASTAGYLLQTNGAGTDPTYAGFLQAGTGAVTRTWQGKAQDVVSIIDFGGVGDNATDNLTAFNAANTYLSSIGGGTIFVPAGIFRVSGAVVLSSKVGVAGVGQGSVIRTTSATADIFQPAGNQVISGLYFDSSVTRTAGAAVKMDGVGQVIISNNYFTGMWASIWITNACSLIWVQTNSIYTKADTTAYGIRIDGPSAVGNDYFIQNNFIRSLIQGTQPLAGIYIDRSGGTYMSNNSVLWCGTGLMLRAASSTTLTWTFSLNDVFDTNNGIGVSLSASSGGTIKGVFFDGIWSSTNGQEGIKIANGGGTIDGVQINNPRVFNNSFYGIKTESGPINVNIRGGATCGNSGAASGTYHGIDFEAGCTNFSVIGTTSGTAYGFSNTQGYGIAVQTGASNNYEISNNIVQGNATGGILDLGSGTTKRVFGNIGAGGTLAADQVPGTGWGIDFTTASAIALTASGGTYDIATGSGLVLLHNDTTGALGMFLCFAGGVTKVAGDATMVVGTAGASQIGLAYNAGTVKYRVSNGYGTTENVYIATTRTRPTS